MIGVAIFCWLSGAVFAFGHGIGARPVSPVYCASAALALTAWCLT